MKEDNNMGFFEKIKQGLSKTASSIGSVFTAKSQLFEAKDNELLVHPEDNWVSMAPVGADNKRRKIRTKITDK